MVLKVALTGDNGRSTSTSTRSERLLPPQDPDTEEKDTSGTGTREGIC